MKQNLEQAAKAQRADQKTFKGGSDVSSQWLTKRNSVNQTHQAFYEPKSAKYVIQGGAHGDTNNGAKKVAKDLVVPKKANPTMKMGPNTPPPKGRALPIRGEGPTNRRGSDS